MRKSAFSRLRTFRSRFARAERGATAIEFALVSLPLLMMVFGLLELALVFLVSTTLDSAMERAARTIRTGEFQTSGGPTTASAFKTAVCGNMTWLSSRCSSDLWLDVRTFPSYAATAAATPPNPTTFDPVHNPPCFSPGNQSDIVLVRAYFEWGLFTPLLDAAMENMGSGSGKRLISSTTAFRNEPYNETPPQGASPCAPLS